ncbi:MAG: hypothetical protein QOH89_251, partial [Pseudonocardiales bacterium]|nr:hypothetical protein [Pseudonocardiales bacterium]
VKTAIITRRRPNTLIPRLSPLCQRVRGVTRVVENQTS